LAEILSAWNERVAEKFWVEGLTDFRMNPGVKAVWENPTQAKKLEWVHLTVL
jgi:hypothetical protein